MMASSKSSDLHIQKLSNSNYHLWSFKMEMLLMKEGVYEVVGQDPPDAPNVKWTQKDMMARALINLNIEDSQIIFVKNLHTSKQTWEKLKTMHERKNLSSRIYLLKKLYSLKLEEGGNVQEHITEMLEIIDRLRGIGEEIKDPHISALLLCSLPESYSTLITALESKTDDELSPDFIKSKVIDEYMRRLEYTSENEKKSKAYKSVNERSKKSIYDNDKTKFCTYCKKYNHDKKDCWFLKKKNSNAENLCQNNRQKFLMDKNGKRYNFNSKICKHEHVHVQENKNNNEAHGHEAKDNEKLQKYPFENILAREQSLIIASESNKEKKWCIDSGATSHMTNDVYFFSKINKEINGNVTVADGNKLIIKGSGEGKLNLKTLDGMVNPVNLKNVLYVPHLTESLLSVNKVTKKGFSVTFKDDVCTIEKNGDILANGTLEDGLYKLMTIESGDQMHELANMLKDEKCKNKNCIMIWHERLGHRSIDAIKQVVKNNLVDDIKIDNCQHSTQCTCCIEGKITVSPYPKKTEFRAKKPLELVHTDLCGPFHVNSLGGKRYIMTFVDDCTRYTMVFLLTNKDEVYSKVKEYIAKTSNKFGNKLKVLRSDNGGEYVNRKIEDYLLELGIKHQLTVPHSPSQNGVAERKNRSLIEMTRCMLIDSKMPQEFWGEAILTANYLQNRLPMKANNNTTPYEMWTNMKPKLNHIRRFGCLAFAHVHKSKRNKLDSKAVKGIMVGFDYRSKGYRIHVAKDNVVISRSVRFVEDQNGYELHPEEESAMTLLPSPYSEMGDDINIEDVSSKYNMSNDQIEKTVHTKDENHEINNCSAQIINKNKINIPEVIETEVTLKDSTSSTKQEEPFSQNNRNEINNVHEPNSWKEMQEMETTERSKWIKAAKAEIKSLEDNKTWELTDLPKEKHAIGSKWVFKVKYNSHGEVERYKARLVAKGYAQRFGADYDETFAPVVKHPTIRSFLVAAAYKKYKVYHLDVQSAFLHGDLDEEIYMYQPEGFEKPGEENKVCKLHKSLYGLKQAARSWNAKITDILKNNKFEQSKADPCLFSKKEGLSTTHLILYVDDILISSNDEKQIDEVMKFLRKEIEVKNLGELSFYLGIEVERNTDGSFLLSQTNKIKDLCQKFNLNDSKPTYTPMEAGYSKIEKSNLLPNNKQFRQAVGALLYISSITRPDITAAVSILSRRNENPRECDWNAIKRIIRYLKTTKNMKLHINACAPATLIGYCDADWANDLQDRKSISGYVFKIGKNPISWMSKKQSTVALSSTEAELLSATTASTDLMWLTNIMNDLDIPQSQPIILFQDNKSCIKLIESEKINSRTKHICVKIHHLRNLQQNKILKMDFMASEDMLADIFTKPLPKPAFERHRNRLGLLNSSGGMIDMIQ